MDNHHQKSKTHKKKPNWLFIEKNKAINNFNPHHYCYSFLTNSGEPYPLNKTGLINTFATCRRGYFRKNPNMGG